MNRVDSLLRVYNGFILQIAREITSVLFEWSNNMNQPFVAYFSRWYRQTFFSFHKKKNVQSILISKEEEIFQSLSSSSQLIIFM